MLKPLSSLAIILVLSACSTYSVTPVSYQPGQPSAATPHATPRGMDVAIYALGLIDVDYRFGGKNPEAGLDCSGMVSHVYREAAGMNLPPSAAQMAVKGRNVDKAGLRPGDLVFFNTRNQPRSHVGIYIGDDRFVHAPSTNGKVKISSLSTSYYASRFEGAITLFD